MGSNREKTSIQKKVDIKLFCDFKGANRKFGCYFFIIIIMIMILTNFGGRIFFFLDLMRSLKM